ncbi:MAG: hypothetical protein IT212_07680 [Bacteroidia bacterium]|nr:hypothetical protein [Bacteroidia bacterium]
MLLISINKNNTVVLHPDAAKLEPILSHLTEDELMLIILAYDYYSPFRQLPEHERMRRAQSQVFKNKKRTPFEEPKIKQAISAYMSLQYDERREQVKTYLAKISTINDAIRLSESPTTIANYVKINAELRKSVNAIEEELLMQEEKDAGVVIQGKGSLSLLEKLTRNEKRYEEVTTRREKGDKNKKEITEDI